MLLDVYLLKVFHNSIIILLIVLIEACYPRDDVLCISFTLNSFEIDKILLFLH